MSLRPKYRVRWTQIETCGTCGYVHKEQYTSAFFTSERALEEATWVLQSKERTLIFMEL
jgi:hypothetical protein